MDTQFTAEKREILFAYLDQVLTTYTPECIGINEVIYDEQEKTSELLTYFERKGYHCRFVPFSPVSKRYTIGSGIMTKSAPSDYQEHVLGPDLPALRRGYTNFEVKTIEAIVPVTKKQVPIRFVVTYLAHLVPLNWGIHQRHYQKLRRLLGHSRFKENVIIVGDFNEPKYHPNIRKLAKQFHRRTGSFFKPTWRLHGRRLFMARANYDNLLWSRNDNLELLEFLVLSDHPSDHAPLFAKFRIK